MRLTVSAIICLLVLALLAACGDDDTTASSTATVRETLAPAGPAVQPPPAQPLSGEAVGPEDGVLEVAAADSRFAPNFLRVPIGDSVTIRVTNNDTIAHSLRLAGLDGVFETEDDAVTNPAQIDGGSSGELTFAPLTAGAYTFRCDFHPTTMGGQIVSGDATPGPTGPPVSAEATFGPESPDESPTESAAE
jgi:plastocyanin